MTAAHVGEKVCHPVVVVKVNGVKCRALLDTGATGTYISALLVDLLKAKPARTLTRGIKTIMGLVTKRIETDDVKISDTQGRFTLPVCATKIVLHMELASSENHHKPHNINPRFNNYSILKKYIYNSQSEQTQINLYLVAEFRKLEFRLTSVAGSRTLRVSSVLN